MFGYVKVCKPELRVREYEEYKAVYCTLCKTLGKEYGVLSRVLLSYDATFYVLLRDCALQAATPCYKKGRCRFNPLKKCGYCENPTESYREAAALTVLMSYQKVLDNIADGKGFKKFATRLCKPFLRGKYKKAKEKYPFFAEQIETAMQMQAALEAENCTCADRAAEPSAKALEMIFSHGLENDENRRVVSRVAYCVGRWVYLMDAYDDMRADLKSGAYNPFLAKYSVADENALGSNEVQEPILRSLYMTENEAAVSFDLLSGTVHRGVLENILRDGTQTATEAVRSSYVSKQTRGEVR
ncbi:MAG: DUF5685 family protein [Clostridia bacterium]|nr:DUF5685 family protein [Clostridia bacterium]